MNILVISARSFGDCIITLELIKYLSINKDIKIDIFTKKEFLPFFKNKKYINNIFFSCFPIQTNAKFSPLSLIKLFFKCLQLRKQNYDIVLNNMGDIRENTIGFLIKKNKGKNISIKFSSDHGSRRLGVEGLSILLDNIIYIPKEIINIYNMQKYIAEQVLNLHIVSKEQPKSKLTINKKIIAIHPLASKEYKMWGFENWIKLINKLYIGNKIIIFCSTQEKNQIEKNFYPIKDKIEVFASSIESFLTELEKINTLICLDSFAAHAAYYKNVKNIIMLNGANDYKMWIPPNAKVVLGNFTCKYYPCYNHPKCTKNYMYICIKSITVDDVLNKIINNS